MSDGVPTVHPATVILERYEDIRSALVDPNLSRTFDRRSYEEGNIRDGIVSTSHGATHRARRRVENAMFRPEVLRLYERELFPGVLNELLDVLIDDAHVDLFAIGELISVVLSARRAGIDHDGSLAQLRTLVRHVDAFSQGAAILDAKDPDAVRALVRATYVGFGRDFVRASWARRAAAIERTRRGELSEDELPQDILTVLLLHRDDPALELGDPSRVVREVATYLQGGTHTSAQTLVNAVDLVFATGERRFGGVLDRVASDALFAQRVIQETLRLRPTTPKMKRRAEADTEVGGRKIPKDALVVLDIATANRDPRLFGDAPDRFDPDRVVDPSVARWGLSFGAGPHQCPGRSVAGGFPVPNTFEVDDDHVFGLIALELQAIAKRDLRPDPARRPELDARTERFTRWASYPVRFERRVTASSA